MVRTPNPEFLHISILMGIFFFIMLITFNEKKVSMGQS